MSSIFIIALIGRLRVRADQAIMEQAIAASETVKSADDQDIASGANSLASRRGHPGQATPPR
ncbi:MAG: hypothetical protein ABJA75_14195 [Bradyrhizobium sp.]